jgi:hypothetical protein
MEMSEIGNVYSDIYFLSVFFIVLYPERRYFAFFSSTINPIATKSKLIPSIAYIIFFKFHLMSVCEKKRRYILSNVIHISTIKARKGLYLIRQQIKGFLAINSFCI